MTKSKPFAEKEISCFHKQNFYRLCDKVSESDKALRSIIETHGYPPMWTRANTFATLIHIILEQQVSLASAKAAFNKLKQKVGRITPRRLLALSDEEMRACYFSRQKTMYARHLAEAILDQKIRLKKYHQHSDDIIREQLTQIKGIGNWTTDVYLLFALQRTDIFPIGDLAMVNALKEVKRLPETASRERIFKIAKAWQPNRSIATMLLWHYYIQTRNIKL
ncbi:MAG: DNA-3-methyladenine glycosylase 2 family protein [Bacteroidota bacterium]